MLVRRICCALLAVIAAAGQEVMRLNTSEILLDLIVRDKRGRLVKDLNPADIVITDGGKQYPATSLRMMSVASPGAESEAPGGSYLLPAGSVMQPRIGKRQPPPK